MLPLLPRIPLKSPDNQSEDASSESDTGNKSLKSPPPETDGLLAAEKNQSAKSGNLILQERVQVIIFVSIHF